MQLIEPELDVLNVKDDVCLQRMGLGTPNVATTVEQLLKAGVDFLVSKDPDDKKKGVLTRTQMGSVTFELVHDDRAAS